MMENLLVIDTLSHGPMVWSEEFVASSDGMLAEGLSPFRIVQELMDQMAEVLVTDDDYFEQYARAWEESGVNCVSWTVGVVHEQPYSLEAAYHNFAFMTRMIEGRPDFFAKVLKAEDIENAHAEGKRAVIFNFQNLDHIGSEISLLDRFYRMGFRIMQLTYNARNQIGCGCTEEQDSGLSELGAAVIERMNELGVLVDVSHCGLKTSMDAALKSKVPIACTHTLARKLYEHDRGKTDEVLQAVAERGGYIGILAVPGFLTERSVTTIDDFVNHLDYIVDLVGLEHVGLGSDFFGFSLPDNLAAKIDELLGIIGFRPEHRASFVQKIKGFEDYTRFPNLIAGLEKRGYGATEIQQLAGQNFMNVFREVVG
jgi:membrane dipeptidase